MPGHLHGALNAFNRERKFNRKGPLCVALVMRQLISASALSLPNLNATARASAGHETFSADATAFS